jgi:dihydrolipoamide dehydrogenase
VEADLVLMATGRVPNFDQSELDSLGIEVENRAVQVDSSLRTNIEGIYAIGDVTGRRMLAHVAAHHGEIAAENISGLQSSVNDDLAPSCIFTSPQIAWVGLTQEQAQASNRSFRTSTFALSASGKAQAIGETHGWFKLIEDAKTRTIIGAHFIGPHVSELISEMTLAIRSGMTASDIAETIHPHPTLSESVREAALGLLDGPIHAAPRVKSFD